MEGERRVARRKGGEEKWEWMVALNPKGGGRIALTLFDTESTRVYEKMSLYMGGGGCERPNEWVGRESKPSRKYMIESVRICMRICMSLFVCVFVCM